MEPITTIAGAVSDLDRADVDTDQIIPKQFLKRIERTGFGEFLFFDWAKEPGWDLPAQPDPHLGAQLRLRLLARARARGRSRTTASGPIVAPSFGDIFYNNCAKIGLLAGRARRGRRARAGGGRRRARSTSRRRRFASPGARVPFEIDPEIRRRLLGGLDDIALTLQQSRRDRRLRGPARAHRPGHHGAVRC